MATRIIPALCSSTRPAVRQRVRLDGRDYLLDLAWNGRESRWYASVYDATGTVIVAGRKLVANARLCQRTTNARRPGGWLVVGDTSGAGTDPGIDDLSERVLLAYIDAADVATVAASSGSGGSGGGGGVPPPPGER